MVSVIDSLVGLLVFDVLAIVVGFALGSVVYVTARVVRRSLVHLDRAVVVHDPHGQRWHVRVAVLPGGLRFGLAERVWQMRPADRYRRSRRGDRDDAVERDSLWHPGGLVDKADEAVVIVAPIVLVVALILVGLFFAELVVAAIALLVIGAWRLLRGGWRCIVVGSFGHETVVGSARRLSEARDLRDRTIAAITRGDIVVAS